MRATPAGGNSCCYSPIDFSRTPAGHLLNLFADVVKKHDEGWFTTELVNALHDAIRVELESRVVRGRAGTPGVPVRGRWESAVDTRVAAEAGDTLKLDLDEPIDPAKTSFVLVEARDDRGPHYQWIIPGHKIRPTASGEFDPHRSYVFSAGTRGFHRSGIGLRLPEDE